MNGYDGTNQRARAWCFTWNNPGAGARRILETINCTYIVYQEEVGANGTRHVQGYVYFKTACTLAQMVRKFGNQGVHFEPARGSPEANKEYCTKEDTRAPGGMRDERGTMPTQGARIDLTLMMEDVQVRKILRHQKLILKKH